MSSADKPLAGIAYISNCVLYVWTPEAGREVVESAFAKSVQERSVALSRRHAWKARGLPPLQRTMLWGRAPSHEAQPDHVCTASLSVSGKDLFYALRSGGLAGIFRVNLAEPAHERIERRLVHTTNCSLDGLGGVEANGYLACIVSGKGGTHIAVVHEDGSDLTELTAGDCMDSFPSWVPGKDRVLVYQTSGTQRNAAGEFVGFTRSVIHQLDIPSGQVDLALELPGYNLLKPRVDGQGRLYCMRRPYRAPVRGITPTEFAWRVVTFPFLLVYAVIVWAGMFIERYTGRTVITPDDDVTRGGPGALARVEHHATPPEDAAEESEPGEKPKAATIDQDLLCCGAEGAPRVIAKHVLDYDLGSDGSVVYTDGRCVRLRRADGTVRELFQGRGVTGLRAMWG